MSSQEIVTRDRILDAAELLFSEHGFRSVSLRQITKEAEVNVASVNYHFGSKEALIFEVLSRIIGPINQQRLELLDIAIADAGKKPVMIEVILDALFRPVVTMIGDTDHSTEVFMKLAGRCMEGQEDRMNETMLELFRGMADRFIAEISRTLEHLDPEEVFWRVHFSIGAMVHALTHSEQLTLFSNGVVADVHDPEETLAQLVAFTAGGLKASEKRSDVPKKRKGAGIASKLGIVIAATLMTSCMATSPEVQTGKLSVAFPKNWEAIEREERPMADNDWIASFGDQTLVELVDEAVESNHDLKGAAARIEIASANARITGADLYPFVQGIGNGRRNKQNFIGFPFGDEGGSDSGGSDSGGIQSSLSNSFGLSLDLSWELDLWGKVRTATAASIADFEASEADFAAARLSIAAQTAKSWFALIEASEQKALAQKTLSVFRDTESSIRDRFERGLADDQGGTGLASQLRLSMVDIANAEDSLAAREELVSRAKRQVELLVGRYPAGKLKSSSRLPSLKGTPPAGIPGDVLDRRPDIIAAERRLASADKRLLEAKLMVFPTIGLTASSGNSGENIRNVLDSDFSVWSLAGNLAQPLFVGGRIKEGVSRGEARIKEAAAEFDQTALVAFSDIENALAAERFLVRREAALQKAVRLSREAYEKATDEFVNGVGDVLTLLQAQQTVFINESALISIRRQRLDNRIDLHLALGGDFETRQHVSAKNESPQS